MKRIFLYLICLLAGMQLLFASSSDKRLYFSHYNTNNRLSQNTVSCILQDRDGFIWIGTNYGLNRFDGVRFKIYENIPTPSVTKLAQDNSGLIWIGTTDGIAIYNAEKDSIIDFCDIVGKEAAPKGAVTDISISDSEEIIIVNEEDGVYSYNPATHDITLVVKASDHNANHFTKLEYDNNGNAWIGSYGRGLYVANSNLSGVKKYESDRCNPLLNDAIITEIITKEDNIYVATESQGLFKINVTNNTCESLPPFESSGKIPFIRSLLFYNQNELWIGTETGLYIMNLINNDIFHYTHDYYDSYSLSDNAIYTLIKDNEGGVWIGSYFGGVDHTHPDTFFKNYYKGNSNSRGLGQRIRELEEDMNGNIWIATEDEGLTKYDRKANSFTHISASDSFPNIQSLCLDNSTLWIGTFGNGLKLYDTNSGQIKSIIPKDNNGLASDYIFSICKTSSNDILIGTMSGLQRYNRDRNTFENEPVFNDIFITGIMESAGGDMWIATYSSGLFCRRKGMNVWKRYNTDDNLPSNRIIGLYEDLHNTIWVMTDEGACTIPYGRQQIDNSWLTESNINGIILQVVEDRNGIFWLTTNKGLYRLNLKTHETKHFGIEDGIISNQFNRVFSLTFRKTASRTPDFT